MSTMHLSPNSSKETIIKASNQVLELSSLRALVIGFDAMVTKAFKHFHMLHVLSRKGIKVKDSVTIYISLIRFAIANCCAVWHHAPTSYHPQEVECIQKFTFKIIVPALSYKEALQCLQLPTLGERQIELCLDILWKIPRRPTLQTSQYNEDVCEPLPSKEVHSTKSQNWKITS